MPKFALFDLDLDEISLCPEGDNPPAKVVIAKAEHSSRTHPGLDRSKKKNWVDQAGGLPDFIERIAKHLHNDEGMSISHAIASAINQCKKWASGVGNVKPETRAKAAKAIAEWEAKKAKAKVTKETVKDPSEPVEDMPDPTEEEPLEDAFLEDDEDEEDVEKKKNPGMNKPHEFVNEDEEKHGKTKCDQCGQAPDSPMHQAARKRSLKKAVLDFLGIPEDDDTEPKPSEGGEVADQETNIKKDDLPAEVVEYIEALEAKVEALEQADEQVEKKEDESEVLAKADPVVRALIEKAQNEAAEAQRIAKEERDLRLNREFIEKARSLNNVNANPDELAELLKGLSEKAPEEAAKLEPLLKAANEQIAKGRLFSEAGRGGAETTISKSIESAAQELMKADSNLTKEQAIVKVYEQNPDLYDQQLQEV